MCTKKKDLRGGRKGTYGGLGREKSVYGGWKVLNNVGKREINCGVTEGSIEEVTH